MRIVKLKVFSLLTADIKELGAKWLVEMSEYISNNPQFITSGFIRSGITDVLDGKEPEDEAPLSSDELTDSESDSGDEALESSTDED